MRDKLPFETIKKIVGVIVLIAAIALLVANRGFKYTSYSYSYVIQASGNLADAVVNDMATSSGVAKVDRVNHLVYFQQITTAEFNQKFAKLHDAYKDKTKDVTIKSYIEQPTPVFTVGSNQLLFALAIIVSIVYLYRIIWKGLDEKDRGREVLVMMLAFISAVVIGIGLISLVSMFTTVSEVTTFFAALAILMVLSTLIWALREYVENRQLSRVDSAIAEVVNGYYDNYRNLLRWTIVAVLILMLALGFRFVLDGAVMLAVMFLVGELFVVWTELWYKVLEFDWKHVAGRINRKSAKSKKSQHKTK